MSSRKRKREEKPGKMYREMLDGLPKTMYVTHKLQDETQMHISVFCKSYACSTKPPARM